MDVIYEWPLKGPGFIKQQGAGGIRGQVELPGRHEGGGVEQEGCQEITFYSLELI